MKSVVLIVLSILIALLAYWINLELSKENNISTKSNKKYINRQFSMSDADRAIYEEILENNPADILVNDGELLLDSMGGDAALAKYLNVKQKNLPSYIAGFPRYIKKFDMVVGLDQVMQAMMYDKDQKKLKLPSSDMFSLLAYVKSIANGEKININIRENVQMYQAYTLGKKTFNQKRGSRGLSCMSCHSKDIIGSVLRTQPLPDLSAEGVESAASWPAYRMTKSSLRTMQRRFQGCMKNALQKVIPIGSAEMVGLEVYLTKKAIGAEIFIPGIKR